MQQQTVTNVAKTYGYELCCWYLLVPQMTTSSSSYLFACQLSFFLLSSLTLLSFPILCETGHLSSRPQTLREIPTLYSLPSVNISSLIIKYISEKLHDFRYYMITPVQVRGHREKYTKDYYFMFRSKFNSPAINHMVIAHCYNYIFHTEERKSRNFLWHWGLLHIIRILQHGKH